MKLSSKEKQGSPAIKRVTPSSRGVCRLPPPCPAIGEKNKVWKKQQRQIVSSTRSQTIWLLVPLPSKTRPCLPYLFFLQNGGIGGLFGNGFCCEFQRPVRARVGCACVLLVRVQSLDCLSRMRGTPGDIFVGAGLENSSASLLAAINDLCPPGTGWGGNMEIWRSGPGGGCVLGEGWGCGVGEWGWGGRCVEVNTQQHTSVTCGR